MTRDDFDCRTCGLCCVAFSDQEVYCDVTPEDEQLLSTAFIKENVRYPTFDTLDNARLVMMGIERPPYGAIKTKWRRMRAGPLRGWELNTCAALRGSVMHRVSCRIYMCRPEVCRKAVRPGDTACKKVHKLMADFVDREKS